MTRSNNTVQLLSKKQWSMLEHRHLHPRWWVEFDWCLFTIRKTYNTLYSMYFKAGNLRFQTGRQPLVAGSISLSDENYTNFFAKIVFLTLFFSFGEPNWIYNLYLWVVTGKENQENKLGKKSWCNFRRITKWSPSPNGCIPVWNLSLPALKYIRDAPFDIWGPRVLSRIAQFFFCKFRNMQFFFADERNNFFFTK